MGLLLLSPRGPNFITPGCYYRGHPVSQGPYGVNSDWGTVYKNKADSTQLGRAARDFVCCELGGRRRGRCGFGASGCCCEAEARGYV